MRVSYNFCEMLIPNKDYIQDFIKFLWFVVIYLAYVTSKSIP